MRYYWELIRHFFISNSRHGTHSPFVYGLASSAIYNLSLVNPAVKVDVPPGFNPFYRKLLSDILTYLALEQLREFEPEAKTGALWVGLQDAEVAGVLSAVQKGSVLVVDEPFKTSVSKNKWKQLTQSSDVTVSINLFHFGLLLYRKGQQKENFLLRYPYWRR